MLLHNQSPQPPPPGLLQPGFENKVMHAQLRIGGALVMCSDGHSEQSRFDGFRLSLTVSSEAEAQRKFAALADGGAVQMPLGRTFWSPCFGMLTDRFGLGWMILTPGEETG